MNINIKIKRKDVQCINCGVYGHTSKYCNCPTTSYGVICYKVINAKLYFVMIQRKDTLCYVEFVRGNYNIQNKNYIMQMFERMTTSERDFITNNEFDVIWNTLWVDNKRNNSYYKCTKEKFNTLKNGYHIKCKDETIFFNLKIALDSSKSIIHEQEWEFPKGRRKLGEKDFHCAVREFNEESNIKLNDVYFYDASKYFEEVYLSMNKIRYRNVYYIAKYMKDPINTIVLYDKNNSNQVKEVRDVQWFTIDEVAIKLENRNREKFEMFKLVNDIIIKKYETTLS
jgi:8-oxo-dGTP pyrophosphatase MutT (NUDIX family)